LQCCTPDWISVASVSTSTCSMGEGATVERGATPPDADGLHHLSERFASPRKLAGDSGLCPRVYQSGERDLRPARQTGSALPALGARRGRHPRLHGSRLPRALPANESAYRQAARRQGRPGRPRPPARQSDLAHAHPQPTLRSQRRHRPPGRLTVLKEMRHRSELQSSLVLS
jgi:hypothetical protein